jgi:hypothetical protein
VKGRVVSGTTVLINHTNKLQFQESARRVLKKPSLARAQKKAHKKGCMTMVRAEVEKRMGLTKLRGVAKYLDIAPRYKYCPSILDLTNFLSYLSLLSMRETIQLSANQNLNLIPCHVSSSPLLVERPNSDRCLNQSDRLELLPSQDTY